MRDQPARAAWIRNSALQVGEPILAGKRAAYDAQISGLEAREICSAQIGMDDVAPAFVDGIGSLDGSIVGKIQRCREGFERASAADGPHQVEMRPVRKAANAGEPHQPMMKRAHLEERHVEASAVKGQQNMTDVLRQQGIEFDEYLALVTDQAHHADIGRLGFGHEYRGSRDRVEDDLVSCIGYEPLDGIVAVERATFDIEDDDRGREGEKDVAERRVGNLVLQWWFSLAHGWLEAGFATRAGLRGG